MSRYTLVPIETLRMANIMDDTIPVYWLVGHPGQGVWMPFDEFHTKEAADKFITLLRKASALCHRQEDAKRNKAT